MLEASGEDVGPAVVSVGGGAVAVGDGVTEGDDGGGAGGGEDVDRGDEVPVIDVMGISKFGRGGGIAVDIPGRGTGAGMARLLFGRDVQVESYGDVGERGDGVVDGIGDIFGAWRNGDIGSAGEGERAIGGGVDRRGGGRERPGDVDGGEVEGRDAESVREVDAEGRAAGGEVEDFADSRVTEGLGREGVLGLGDLLGGAPGGDPDRWRRSGADGHGEREEKNGGGENLDKLSGHDVVKDSSAGGP